MVQFAYCHNVIKYFMRDMMNYHCLRVFRSRVKRIGKHSPGFSMFRTRVHGCSEAELCCVPIQNTENVDCEVYKKPNDKKFTPQDTEQLPRSNHDDLLEVQYLHLS